MIGLIYILLCFTIGWSICTYALPGLNDIVNKDYNRKKIFMSPYILLLPAWFVTGTLAVTWPTYLIAYLFGNRQEPLLYANMIVMPIAFLISFVAIFLHYHKKKWTIGEMLCKDKKTVYIELAVLVLITALACVLMWTTFFAKNRMLYVGISVFSDFSPHIGMIRSFSYGNNFPTTYSHYAGQDIKYHFMFQFLAGNLEYLGLRLDWAFNLPSIFSFISAFLLLYVLAVKITGKIGAGALACLFFAFRSAKTLFTYLANVTKGTSIIDALGKNKDFISDTTNENWGLWNLNVYCNQRHLAFGLSVMFLILIIFMPHLFDMFNLLKEKCDNHKGNYFDKFVTGFKTLFFTKEAWLPENLIRAIVTGIILGSLAFFHGAAVICCIMILFFMAALSGRRLEYVITAVIALILSSLQTHLFIHGSALAPKILFGFIAENKTFFGTCSYLDKLLGILPLVILAAFCVEKGVGRYLILVFSIPLVFAFTVSLTIDVTVNHKYIMMSCILLGIFAAALLEKMLSQRDFLMKCVGVFLIICLTCTGFYDFLTVLKKNTPQTAIVLNLDDPLTTWIHDHSDSKDIFLSSNYALNQAVLGGAMLYEGWPYFPWSAGYDTDFRSKQVALMYGAQTPTVLDAYVKKNNIRFIIVDYDARHNESFTVNEENIKATYQCVFSENEGDYATAIYDTKQPIYK